MLAPNKTSPYRITTGEPQRIAAYVAGSIGISPITGNFTAIGLERYGQLIAGVVYSDWNGRSATTSIAITGRINRAFLRFIFYYPFVQLKANRLTATIEANNLKSQRLVEHMGFKKEAVLEDAGRFGDVYVYRLFGRECRYHE